MISFDHLQFLHVMFDERQLDGFGELIYVVHAFGINLLVVVRRPRTHSPKPPRQI